MTPVTIYTDGSSRGNPGPGGFGLILMSGEHVREASAGYRHTTNNRMELMAVIVALQMLKKPCVVDVYTDSQYVKKSIMDNWLKGWLKTDFKGKKNKDLWLKYVAVAKPHTVTIHWVKGHSTNKYNNRCDALATAAADGVDKGIDTVFENEGSLFK